VWGKPGRAGDERCLVLIVSKRRTANCLRVISFGVLLMHKLVFLFQWEETVVARSF
jgi:hypothetical protein